VRFLKGNQLVPTGTSQAAATEGFSTNGDGEWYSLDRMEEFYAARVLEHTGGNKQAAARILDIDRKTLSRIISRGSTNTHSK
jgi:DNA-binding NtrC family response regulator